MSVMSTAFYAKNVPTWERLARVAISLAVIVYGFSLPAPWSWLMTGAAAGFALTGLVGFCPACAMVGRRPIQKESR
jgi:hypothetical protein